MADEQGPICVSVINMKGGVGKTTVAALLARYANSLRPFDSYPKGLSLDTLLIDLDPQANLSQAFMREQVYRQFLDDGSSSIVEVFKGYQPPTSYNPSPTPLDVSDVVRQVGDIGYSIVNGEYRQNVRRGMDLIPSRFDFSDNLIDSIRPDPRIIARLISRNFQDKDLIFIDCAPTESIFTQAAYHASRYILIPVRPEYFATIGFPLLNDSLAKFRNENQGHQIDVIGIVINNGFYDGGNRGGPEKKRAINEINSEVAKNGLHIFENEIPHSRNYPRMMRGDFDHIKNADTDFAKFASEFFQKIGF